MELYQVKENGQLEINFEALEIATDFIFADSIKSRVESGGIVVRVVPYKDFFEVWVKENYSILIYSYTKESRKMDAIILTESDVDFLKGQFQS